jgi:hypothetical protein
VRVLKILAAALSVLFFTSSNAFADPTVVLGETRGTVETTGTTLFTDIALAGEGFVFQEITPINADRTRPGFVGRGTNIYWNVLPIDNSEIIDLTALTTTVWGNAPQVTTTFGDWLEDYIANYGNPQPSAIAGFTFSNTANYRAVGLLSLSGADFFLAPSSVDLNFGGSTYRALAIGVNSVLFEFELGTPPEPIILPDFYFVDPNESDSRVQISSRGDQLICNAGKYLYGIPQAPTEAPMTGVTYSLFLDGALISAVVANDSSYAFDTSLLNGESGLATCSLRLSMGGATLYDESDWNPIIVSQAQSAKSLASAETVRAASYALSTALANLDEARTLIRSFHTEARKLRNANYASTIADLKSKLELGSIDTKQFIALLRELNFLTLKSINQARAQKTLELAANNEAKTKAVIDSQIALVEALRSIDTQYVKTLEDAGYAVTIE